jgi:DNA-binding transcriptional regulator YiaG
MSPELLNMGYNLISGWQRAGACLSAHNGRLSCFDAEVLAILCNPVFTFVLVVVYSGTNRFQERSNKIMARKTAASKTKKLKAAPNRVKELRTDLGMFQNDLARSAKISVASIRGTESQTRDLSDPLKARIVNALKKEAANQGKPAVDFKDVFPNDPVPHF